MSAHLLNGAGRLIVLAVALVGLMAMHGLSDHGVVGPSSLSVASTPMEVAHHGGHADGPADGPADDQRDHHEALVGVCMAVLASLLTFVLVGARSGPGMLGRSRRLRYLAAASAVRARARGPSPPDLRLLSIARC